MYYDTFPLFCFFCRFCRRYLVSAVRERCRCSKRLHLLWLHSCEAAVRKPTVSSWFLTLYPSPTSCWSSGSGVSSESKEAKWEFFRKQTEKLFCENVFSFIIHLQFSSLTCLFVCVQLSQMCFEQMGLQLVRSPALVHTQVCLWGGRDHLQPTRKSQTHWRPLNRTSPYNATFVQYIHVTEL